MSGTHHYAEAPETTPTLLLVWAVACELILLVAFLGIPPVAQLLGGAWPPALRWSTALLAGALVLTIDGLYKRRRRSDSD